VAVLGVLVVTPEYATGTIRVGLAAVPRRPRLLAAKAAVAGGLALLAGGTVLLASFLVAQAVLGDTAPRAGLDQPGVLRAVLGGGLYLALVALGAVAVGVLVRATAGAVTVMLCATLLVPAFTPILPRSLAVLVGTFWPTLAGNKIMTVVADPRTLDPWTGLAVMAAWVVALLVAALVVLQRRDA
jgi:ABC-type transport system involved in multi-copper enzyme maturation permease subunit